MKKVLVTGATGFVGRALCAHLSRNGWHVRASIRGATDFGLASNCEVIRVPDIGPDTNWLAAVSGMDAVVHLAARVHVMRNRGADVLGQYRRINTAGTLSLARASASAQVRRFIFLSTVKVHGERTVTVPFTELDTPCPVDPYAISKLEAEHGLAEISHETGLTTTFIRPPLIYGPGVKGNFFRLMSLVRRRIPLPVANIANSRSLLCIDNLTSAIEAALAAPSPISGAYLISDNCDLSTPDLVARISAAMGFKPLMFACPPGLIKVAGRIVGIGGEVGRMIESLRVDCSLLQQNLRWRPSIDVNVGIAAATQAYQHTISQHTRP